MVIQQIIDLPEEELLRRLGALTVAQSSSPGAMTQAADVDSDALAKFLEEEDDAKTGFMRTIGMKVLKHASSSLHEVICRGGSDDVKTALEAAKANGKLALVGFFAAQLATAGFDPAMATVIAVLLAGVIIAVGQGTVCGVWADYNSTL